MIVVVRVILLLLLYQPSIRESQRVRPSDHSLVATLHHTALLGLVFLLFQLLLVDLLNESLKGGGRLILVLFIFLLLLLLYALYRDQIDL